LPCYNCGEKEKKSISIKLTDETFPLCSFCQKVGRGAAPRRKQRAIKVKEAKKQNQPKKLQKAKSES